MITHDLNVAQWAERTVRIVDGEMFEEIHNNVMDYGAITIEPKATSTSDMSTIGTDSTATDATNNNDTNNNSTNNNSSNSVMHDEAR